MLKLDLSKLDQFLPQDYVTARQDDLAQAADMLARHNGPGGDFTVGKSAPDYDKEEFARIKAAAKKIRRQSRYWWSSASAALSGARAVIELLASPTYLKQKNTPDIYFTGNGLSTDALLELIALGDRDFSVNVISKSGTTTEPAWPSASSGPCWRRSMAGGARSASMPPPTRPGRLKGLADRRAMRSSWCPMTWAGVFRPHRRGPAAHRRRRTGHRPADGRGPAGHGGAVRPRPGQPAGSMPPPERLYESG